MTVAAPPEPMPRPADENGFEGAPVPTATDTTRFRRGLSAVCAAALAIRLGYVLVFTKASQLIGAGDAFYYSAQGETIARGRGFAQPFYFAGTMPAADHPPLNALVMSLAPLLVGPDRRLFGLPAFVFWQRITLVIVGTVTVACIGMVGRRLGGHRIGLLAAGVAAISPNLWINDGILMSESITALMVSAVLWTAIAAWDEPDLRHWAVFGASIGAAALARSELVTLFGIMAVPMIAMRHRTEPRRLASSAMATGLAGVVVCSLWIVPNAMRFEERVLFSTSDGLTLVGANCPDTYSGEWRGVWTTGCLRHFDTDANGVDDASDLRNWNAFDKATEDQSEVSHRYQRAALEFVGDHLGDVPEVAAIRVLRTWGLWRPDQMAEYNRGEGRRPKLSWLAWFAHLSLLPLCAAGVAALRRSGRPVWPFLAMGVSVTLTSALIYGLARFRLGWDVAACVLAAAGLDFVVTRYRRRPRPARDLP